jgi:SAM-dependent methyltransferase/uncharacterized protein YbaR (Trm112 family)
VKPRLLDLIVCPHCGSRLAAEQFAGRDEIEEGALRCAGCARVFPVIGGVPRLLPDALAHLVPPMHPAFFRRHAAAMAPFLARAKGGVSDAAVHAKRRTLVSYSYQWRKFKEMFPHWEEVFRWSIAPIQPSFFPGKTGLDAGCGFGRSLHYAASYGAEVIGLDLSEAVEAARDNTRHLPGAHVVQGDIFRPPVPARSLDFVYSIGVLQHLPDPRGGFIGLTRLLKPGAPAFVWVYPRGRGRQIALFTLMRVVSTRLPLRAVSTGALALAIGQWALWIAPYRALRRSRSHAAHRVADRLPFTLYARYPFRVLHADWVDNLSVPLVDYYKADQIDEWLRAAGLERIRTASPWDGRAVGWAPQPAPTPSLR